MKVSEGQAADVDAIAKAVMAYAEEHWGQNGWDMIAECWSHQEIVDALKAEGLSTVEAGVEFFAKRAGDWREAEDDKEAEWKWLFGY